MIISVIYFIQGGDVMFSTRIKLLREEKNVMQKDVSDIVGVSQSTYNLYENGKREPNFETLIKIAKYFNVTTDYLLGASECRSAENDDINKRLGLSDEALKSIKYTYDNSKSNNPTSHFNKQILRALNVTLEETLNLFISIDNYAIKKIQKECFEKAAFQKFVIDKKIDISKKDLDERGYQYLRYKQDNRNLAYFVEFLRESQDKIKIDFDEIVKYELFSLLEEFKNTVSDISTYYSIENKELCDTYYNLYMEFFNCKNDLDLLEFSVKNSEVNCKYLHGITIGKQLEKEE